MKKVMILQGSEIFDLLYNTGKLSISEIQFLSGEIIHKVMESGIVKEEIVEEYNND